MINLLMALLDFLLAVCLGGLIGLEREFWRKKLNKAFPFGIRTTILISMTGLIFVYLGQFIDLNISVTLGLLTVLLLIVSNYFIRSRILHNQNIGMTSYFAEIISFMIGLLVGLRQYLIAVIVAVITTLLLTAREEIHKIVKLMTFKELRSTIYFAVIAFIILPLLPDAYIDFLGVFNPYRFWITVILITSISFISYIITRMAKNGLPFAGFLGGFVSSKAVVNDLALKVRVDKGLRDDAFKGIILSMASNLIFCLIISIINFYDFKLFNYVILPLFLSTAIILYLFVRGKSDEKLNSVVQDNPFSMKNALRFAFLLFIFTQVIAFTSKVVNPNLVYVVILLSSIVNLFASVASITSLIATGGIDFMLGVNLFVFACVIALLDKLIFVKVSRDKKLIRRVIKATLLWSALIISILIIENYFLFL